MIGAEESPPAEELVPLGTIENSPAIYRWENGRYEWGRP
jgi:hypothetical protein